MTTQIDMTPRAEFAEDPPDDSPEFLGRAPVPALGVGTEAHGPDLTLFADVAAHLKGELPEPPARNAGLRSDGEALFYAGQVNWIFGDPEGGKTLLALATCVERLNMGGKVAILDLDHNGLDATLSRLHDLGVQPHRLEDRERFFYVEPLDEWNMAAIIGALVQVKPDFVVVDSVGELLPLMRLSSNSPDDFTMAHVKVLKPLAMAGAAVVAIDHLAKNPDSRSAGPTGTSAKKRAVGGVSLRVQVKEQFAPGRGGRARITINKDRHGGLRAVCPPAEAGSEVEAGTFVISAGTNGDTWKIWAPAGVPTDSRLGPDVEALKALDPPPSSQRDVKGRMGWGTARATAAWRAFSSCASVPTPYKKHEAHCSECSQPMTDLGDGATTHPTCSQVLA